MDYSELPNPYDFANPVNNPNLFAGRSSILEEVRYYLDHAKTADRTINLAIIGGRASGKTSILNMINYEAEQRNFYAVRVDLDEGDGQSALAFFYKLFDSIITTVCAKNHFGGISGQIFDRYRTIVDTLDTSDVGDGFPFIFPIQYSKAISANNPAAQVSDTAIKMDLLKIHETIKSPLVIIMDECDILGRSRIQLEKLRNIFMNTEGFMLVVTGTEKLFPVIDEIYSPIIRQFKKIIVGPFNKTEETMECIRRPLQNLDIDPFEILDMETYFDAPAIHDLSGGRPYEIQLLCHLLFRRVKQGSAKKMALNSDILDEVLKELQPLHDSSVRPVVTKIRNLTPEQLSAIGVLCAANKYSNFEQAWFNEFVLNSSTTWNKESLSDHMNYLRKIGLLTLDEEGTISFIGDDFDRLYCKYYARKLKVNAKVENISLELFAKRRMGDLLRRNVAGIEFEFEVQDIVGLEVVEVSSLFADENSTDNPFDVNFELALSFYQTYFNFHNWDTFQLFSINLISPWYKVCRFYALNDTFENEIEGVKPQIDEVIESIRARATILEGNIEKEVFILPVVSPSQLIRKVELANNKSIKLRLYYYHMSEAVNHYVDTKNKGRALLHGDAAYAYLDVDEDKYNNNLGYLYLSAGNLERAKVCLEQALFHPREEGICLPRYNYSIVLMMENDIKGALNILDGILKDLSGYEESHKVACLFVPIIKDGVLGVEEIFQVKLRDTVIAAVDVLSHYNEK